MKFGRWTALHCLEGPYWFCRCECGETRRVAKGELTRSRRPSLSCGCLMKEQNRARMTTHGKTNSPEYQTWRSMISRSRHRPGYAGRVRVCKRWRGPDGFTHFLSDLGPKPSKTHSIDRIDGSGHYEPSNCRWATPKEQSSNTKKNTYLTIDGETLTISEWGRRVGIRREVICARRARGWTDKDAVQKPPDQRFNWRRRSNTTRGPRPTARVGSPP